MNKMIDNGEILDIEYHDCERYDVLELYQKNKQGIKENITISKKGAAELIKVLQEWVDDGN